MASVINNSNLPVSEVFTEGVYEIEAQLNANKLRLWDVTAFDAPDGSVILELFDRYTGETYEAKTRNPVFNGEPYSAQSIVDCIYEIKERREESE